MHGHSTRTCAFEGCGRRHKARGLCSGHLWQQYHGKPLGPLRRLRPHRSSPVIEYDEIPCPNPELEGPCHMFRGCKDRDGYGFTSIGRRSIRVHRYTWEQANGPIADGLVIDHRCRNRPCCNPAHLRLVSMPVNSMENSMGICAINSAKTHCLRGHPFDEENTYYIPKGGRACKACQRERDKHRHARRIATKG